LCSPISKASGDLASERVLDGYEDWQRLFGELNRYAKVTPALVSKSHVPEGVPFSSPVPNLTG
jgi:hypothetical protein